LEVGRASFVVTPNPSRRFVVDTPVAVVSVLGTSFDVDAGATQTGVLVHEGRVAVSRKGSDEPAVVLGPQERFSTVSALPPDAAPASPVTQADPGPIGSGTRPTAAGDVKRLFELAVSARAEGRPKAAAEVYGKIVRLHPADARAALAALELARIRLDALGDPAGALAALDTAARIQPRGALRREIDARRVEALQATGDLSGCRSARDAFLRAHATDPLASLVAGRCSPSSPSPSR
jgi:tetratricopeptide (TPR) repeat protein